MAQTLSFNILATNRASPVFDKIGKDADGVSAKLAGFGKVAALGLAGVAAGAAALAPKLLGAAGQLEQMGAKAATVFGPQLGAVEKWSKGSAAAMGLTLGRPPAWQRTSVTCSSRWVSPPRRPLACPRK